MGCYTAYLVREGGVLVGMGQKFGRTDFEDADAIRSYVREYPEDQWTPTSGIPSTWCSGWFVDFDARVARTYRCSADVEAVEVERDLRAAPGWHGWDLDVAWERSIEVSVLAGLVIEEDEHAATLDEWVGCTEAGLLTAYPNPKRFPYRWDAKANRLEFDAHFGLVGTAIAMIDERGWLRDYCFDDCVLFPLLGRGPAIVETLRTHAPCPAHDDVQSGATIDEAERAIHLWVREAIAPATYAELRRRWPGWTIARERAGKEGLFERTQRAPAGAPRHYALPARSLVMVDEVPNQTIELPPIPEDEARLLAAIAADPAADAPRMVYADLLIARGDPRGQFINLQIEIARLDASSPRRRELEEQASHLQRTYLRDHVPAIVLGYRRGFISRVQCKDVAHVIEHALLDVIPTLEDLNMWEPLDAASVRALGDVPGVGRLHGLEVRPAAGGLAELGRTPALAELRRLQVRTDEPAIARELGELLATGALHRLEHLELDDRGFDDDGLVAVARGLSARTSSLAYRRALTGAGARALAACPSLRHLRRLAFNWLDEESARALAGSPHLDGLRELRIPSGDEATCVTLRDRFGDRFVVAPF